ncbi:MAG: methyltransferase domain-containing protein, partial [Acidimicrobiales bacterium]
LGDRLAALEERAARSAPPDPGPGPERADLSAWHGLVLEELSGATGRVLHAECGDGELVAVLRRSGLDAYGVDPGAESESAALRGEELWPDSALDHLGAVSDGALGGLVLSGCVDRLPVHGQRRLVGLAAARLAAGASVVLLASSAQAWARQAPSAQVDLAGGRPLHAQTWRRLLAEAGLRPARVTAGPRVEGLGLTAGPGPEGGAIGAAMARLDELLFGPSSFAVVASRAP